MDDGAVPKGAFPQGFVPDGAVPKGGAVQKGAVMASGWGTGLVYCMACTGLVSIMSRVGGPCAFILISVAILAQACSCFAPDS